MPGPAVDDGAFDPHQRDVLAQAKGRRRGSHLAARALPGPDTDRCSGATGQMRRQPFLADDPIHRVRLDGHVVAVGRAVDQLLRTRAVEQPRLGDRREQLLVLRLEQPADLFAQLVGHARLGERVGRRLVGRDLHEIRPQAESREPVGEKQARARETQRADAAGRHQEDLVAGAREVIGAGAVRGRPGDHPLARVAEPADELPEVLQGGHRHPCRSEMQNDPFDPRIARDRVETLAQHFDAESLPGHEALPQRRRRIRQRGQVLFEHEDDEGRRPADRAADARDKPPQVAERIQEQPRPSRANV